MLLDAGQIAKKVARQHLDRVCAPETSGTALAKGKLERLVSKRLSADASPDSRATTHLDITQPTSWLRLPLFSASAAAHS